MQLVPLMQDFIIGKLSTEKFTTVYLEVFKRKVFTEEEFSIYNNLFLVVEAYNPNKSSFDPEWDTDEVAVKAEVRLALLKIQKINKR